MVIKSSIITQTTLLFIVTSFSLRQTELIMSSKKKTLSIKLVIFITNWIYWLVCQNCLRVLQDVIFKVNLYNNIYSSIININSHLIDFP